MLAEIPRSQPLFTTIKMERFRQLVLKRFERASKMMPKTINGPKQNGKALPFDIPICVAD
jgi:hypothetical protein